MGKDTEPGREQTDRAEEEHDAAVAAIRNAVDEIQRALDSLTTKHEPTPATKGSDHQ